MKQGIHPTYHQNATIRCENCGTSYAVGSTAANLNVEICANCHPFFSGKGSLVDTAKRIDRFRKRQEKARR